MKRKKMTVVALVVFATALGTKSVLLAQTPYEQKVQRITEKMTEKFNLSEAQTEEVYTINLIKAEAYQTLKDTRKNTPRKERKQQFKSKIATWKSELKKVLNDDQLKKLRVKK